MPVSLLLWCTLTWAGPAKPIQEVQGLVRFVEEAHPAPFQYVSREQWHETVDAELARLDKEPDRIGRAVHRILAPIGDAHLAVGLPEYQPNAPTISVLPLYAVRGGSRWLVDAADGLDPGSELLAVDGRPIDEVIATLTQLVLADGVEPESRLAALEADFPKYWTLEYGQSDTFIVRIEDAAGPRDVQLDGASQSTMKTLASERTSEFRPRSQAPSVQLLQDGTAHLSLPTFGIADMDAYKVTIDELWPQIASADQLIIDIRGNPGGYRPNGFVVLDRLLTQPYPQWKRYRGGPIPRVKGSASVKPMFPNSEQPGGDFSINGDPLVAMMQPTATPFAGQVAVLVDGRTNSAANTFMLALERARPETVVVGRPPMGSCDTHIGEFPVVYRLGASDVHVLLSLFAIDHLAPSRCDPGHGLSPDVEVRPTAEHRRTGADADVEAALSALQALRTQPPAE